MPYSPVINDCAEVKQLLLRITYRLASVFLHLTTKAIPDQGRIQSFERGGAPF